MPDDNQIRLPGPEDRTIIIGPTGSGKTYAGLWLLSMQDLENQRWIIVDYKREKQIAQIPYAQFIGVGVIPRETGVYIVRPLIDQGQAMEDYLRSIWDEENIGLFVDEGAELSNSTALDIILMQGRSKNIPAIILTQRPVGISRYAFSEAQFRMDFPTDDKREQKTISEFMPLFRERHSEDHLIPQYHSYYYDVTARKIDMLGPVPKLQTIMKTFEQKLRPPAEKPLEKNSPRCVPI